MNDWQPELERPAMRDHETIKINCLFTNTVYLLTQFIPFAMGFTNRYRNSRYTWKKITTKKHLIP